MVSVEYSAVFVAALLLGSLLLNKLALRTGIPTLLFFLGLGMLVGSDVLGLIDLNDPELPRIVGTIALVLILFRGGLDTHWSNLKPFVRDGVLLSTVGVLISTVLIGLASQTLFGLQPMESYLLGAIISPTDAAAVFTALRSRNLSLRHGLENLAELESGTNDPMSVFLTLGFLQAIQSPEASLWNLVPHFFLEMGIGVVAGYMFGRLMVIVINSFSLEFDGLYPVLTLAMTLLCYGVTVLVNGSGFLAVYIAGVVMNTQRFYHKRTLNQFHDGIAWLSQIVIFLTLGVLVFPSHLPRIAAIGVTIALLLVFVVRPLSIFGALLFTRYSRRDKLMISWLGLRGATPIILATVPFASGLLRGQLLFEITFFVVVISVLLQGSTLPWMGRLLGLLQPMSSKLFYERNFGTVISDDSELMDIPVPYGSRMIGKSIMDLGLPRDAQVMLIRRAAQTIVPSGRTLIEPEDILVVLANLDDFTMLGKTLQPAPSESRST